MNPPGTDAGPAAGHFDTVVSAETCARHLACADWRFIDCRFDLGDKVLGVRSYREGHVPGAWYAHLEEDLSGAPDADSGRHPLPDWRHFADRLTRWGVYPDTQVVVYDQGSGAFAARLWWMLRTVGHLRVAVLDGGWAAWQGCGGAESRTVPAPHTHSVTLSPGGGWVTTPQVEANLARNGFLVVDARSRQRFAGENEPIDPVAGHIPGAVCVPFEQNLGPTGLFRERGELHRSWCAAIGERSPHAVVHMCGSGVTACHNLLAMEIAGLTGSRLYAGSWSEWIRNPARPIATGDS